MSVKEKVDHHLNRLEERRSIYMQELEIVKKKLEGRMTYREQRAWSERKAAVEAMLHEMYEAKKTLEDIKLEVDNDATRI